MVVVWWWCGGGGVENGESSHAQDCFHKRLHSSAHLKNKVSSVQTDDYILFTRSCFFLTARQSQCLANQLPSLDPLHPPVSFVVLHFNI